ncbi:MAG: hypothetical protein IPH13_00220 [Planctomycetes bacterium]|nr:hypothetical protein [Planctomycetota bacterium]MCC7172435.1 hypothetical protein [Planctomycetota bacterium]
MSSPVMSAVIAAVVATGTGIVLHQLVAEPPPAAAISPDTSSLESRMGKLEAELTSAVARLDAATAALEAATVERAEQRAQAQATADAQRKADVAPTAKPAVDAQADGAMTEAELAGVIGELIGSGTDWDTKEALWAKIKAAGQLDAAIAQIEELVGDDPENADLQTDLGGAYLQKLFTVTEDPQKGVWALKADSAYDAALKVNPQHWTARFSKATSLAFWPPIFGKQGEAISNFETLVTQQEASGTSKPEYAQTYVFLGNLYELQGKTDKAKEIWNKGAGKFPGSAELKGKVAK